jgi:hypothetical protein
MKLMKEVDKQEYEKTMTTLKDSHAQPHSIAREYEGTVIYKNGKYFLETKDGEIPFTGNDTFLRDPEKDDVMNHEKDILERYGKGKEVKFMGVIINNELYPYGSEVSVKEDTIYRTFSSANMPLQLAKRREQRISEEYRDLSQEADEKGWQGLPSGSFKKLLQKMEP